jgi:DNA polymerase-3 subunit gamma/tau
VRWAPPVIELRPEPDAPRDLAQRLASLLQTTTGTRWTIVLSAEAGQQTLARQGLDADAARRQTASEHPMVKAILATFPGARIEAVRDPLVDDYGLPSDRATSIPLGEPDMPDFVPLEAEE